MRHLRVGLIIDDRVQTKMIRDFIQDSKESNHYSLDVLIVQRNSRILQRNIVKKSLRYAKRHGIVRTLSNILFKLVCLMESRIVRLDGRYKDFFDTFSIDSLNVRAISVTPDVSQSGFVYRYKTSDIEKISNENLDLLIRGGSGILRGEILTVCKFGVLSFHHGDNDKYRGGPPGFWEVYNRETSTGFIIQQLTEELDGGDVLLKGSISTAWYYSLNLANLYTKANRFLHKVIEDMAKSECLPEACPKVPYAYPLYTIPSVGTQLLYCMKTLAHVGSKIARKLSGRAYRWRVAYQFVDDWRDITLWRSTGIRNPSGHFLADPFVVFREGMHVCFMEDYNLTKHKGSIRAVKIGREGYDDLGIVLEEKFHMSYPFLFEHNGKLFMCPETSAANDIRIYECTDFPTKWELWNIIMENVSAADSNIFYANDKWWFMTNIDSSNIGDHSSELHLFSSPVLDSASWVAHSKNPVIFDSNLARNGGLISEGGNYYRVFQSQGWDAYGKLFGVAKIVNISDSNYEEENQFVVVPKFFRGLRGTHTYSYHSGLSVLDISEFRR